MNLLASPNLAGEALRNDSCHCAFVDQAQLALYADLNFWQHGLLSFCSICCARNINKLVADQQAAEAGAPPNAQKTDPAQEIEAHSLMQTVIMSFARGLTHGKQELPLDDMYVYFPVQIVQSLVESINQLRYQQSSWHTMQRTHER